ncbi:hypothetical protein FPV67DRAFT_1666866 [Lyophyllum atratum]|nr:hypothetical protein FPV67DRAFT_1666866 [Lyophyllum atratum]
MPPCSTPQAISDSKALPLPPSCEEPTHNISELPLDVLLEIFILSIPDRPTRPSITIAPLQLMGVCTAWRALATSITRLWTSLEISYNTKLRPGSLNAFVHHWTKNAGVRPLSMSYDFPTLEVLSENPRIIETALVPFLPRIQHLEISAQPEVYRSLLSVKPHDLACLESIALTNYNVHDNSWESRLVKGKKIDFSGCRSLKKITLNSYSMSSFVRHMLSNVPWSQITSLKLFESESLHPTRARSVLMECTSLVECEMSINRYTDAEHWDPPDVRIPVVLPHLIYLSVRFSGSSGSRFAPLFQAFSLPRLDTLSIAADFSADRRIAYALIDLRERSHPFPLRHLTLSRVSAPSDSLLVFLRGTPSIETLNLHASECHDYPKLLREIGYDGMQDILLPNLTSLSITDGIPEDVRDFLWDGMKEMGVLMFSLHDDAVLLALGRRLFVPVSPPLRMLERVVVTWTNAPAGWCGEQGTLEVRDETFNEKVALLREVGLDLKLPILPSLDYSGV